MKKELTPQEIKFNLNFTDEEGNSRCNSIPEIDNVYKKIGRAINIDKEGYNLYLIDSYSKDKLKCLMNYIREKYKGMTAPKDICYVTLEDEKKPEVLLVQNGNGRKLKDVVEDVKSSYLESIEEFYQNSSGGDSKDEILDEIDKKRSSYINDLMDSAKAEGFDVKASTSGFAFIPLKEGKVMSEKEYDNLSQEEKDSIIEKASKLKKKAEMILEKLREMESTSIKKLKGMYSDYLTREMDEIKDDALLEFINDDDVYEYLERLFMDLENNVINCYTMNLENDEDEIEQLINKYRVQVLVDNSLNSSPVVIFEEDPTINNLMGFIEYESNNGVYTTDISLINPGSLLKANEGCLIINISSLASNAYSYYYLKKALMSNKITYDTSKGFSEILSISGLKPKHIPIKVKVILIGDYQTYDILYNGDSEFRKIFPIKAEFKDILDINNNVINYIRGYIDDRILKDSIKRLDDDAIYEIIKYLSRKTNSKKKLSLDDFEIDKILTLANTYADEEERNVINKQDIIQTVYEKEEIEEDYLKMYSENKVIISTKGKKVGSINALAVLDTGYYSFGKPMRVTCICYKGSGKIIDTHRESRLSGKIHEKSINILEGLLNNILNPYEKISVDFHLSFEQTYGLIEGDSASVAETICLLSALSKRPIRQNIAVTGSLNQFGEVQVIGGVNEKVEGFYKICDLIDEVKDKGVLIPEENKDELILIPEVEKAIEEGIFHIYTMSSLEDAIETLILDNEESIETFFEDIKKEMEKYTEKSDKSDKEES